MRTWVRRFLHAVLVAVAVGASSLSGYAAVLEAFDSHVHGGHAHHGHAGHDHVGLAHDADVGGSSGSDHEPASSDRVCDHMHAHCCASFAVPAAECGLKLGHVARPVVRMVLSHMPSGEDTSSLFRPPRAAA